MACLAAVLAAALGALCRPRGPIAGLCGPTAPVGHLCKRGAAAGLTLAGWKGADAPRRARREGAVHGLDPSLRAALVPLVTAAARALVEPARLRERGCAGLDGLAGAGGDARRAEQLLQKEVELARCDVPAAAVHSCITLPLLRTFPLHAQRHDSR